MAITDHEQAQINAVNMAGRSPVVFVHGLWLLPSSQGSILLDDASTPSGFARALGNVLAGRTWVGPAQPLRGASTTVL